MACSASCWVVFSAASNPAMRRADTSARPSVTRSTVLDAMAASIACNSCDGKRWAVWSQALNASVCIKQDAPESADNVEEQGRLGSGDALFVAMVSTYHGRLNKCVSNSLRAGDTYTATPMSVTAQPPYNGWPVPQGVHDNRTRAPLIFASTLPQTVAQSRERHRRGCTTCPGRCACSSHRFSMWPAPAPTRLCIATALQPAFTRAPTQDFASLFRPGHAGPARATAGADPCTSLWKVEDAVLAHRALLPQTLKALRWDA